MDLDTDEIWIFLPSPDTPVYPYTFVPVDFYGMQNPYLETSIIIDGQTRIVERKKADFNQITFFMEQWHSYGLTWRCDQGTYSQIFSAETTFTTSLMILPGAFPTSTVELPEATATRVNTTYIQVTYVDGAEATLWLYVQVFHKYGSTEVTDYSVNTTSNSYTLDWTDADNETDYYVKVMAYSDGVTYTFNFVCALSSTQYNPWAGLFDFLGTLPGGIDASQLLVTGIIMLFLAIGSYQSAGFSCLIAWIIAGIFIAIGWFTCSLPVFGFAGFTTILVWIHESKQTEREL